MIDIKYKILSLYKLFDMDLNVKNPNKVASSTPATAFLNYRGQLVSKAPLLTRYRPKRPRP
jgi:hypothetical protein